MRWLPLVFVFAATPTIVTGRGGLPIIKTSPSGFLPFQYISAIRRFTIATFGALSLSLRSNARPATIGIPNVAK